VITTTTYDVDEARVADSQYVGTLSYRAHRRMLDATVGGSGLEADCAVDPIAGRDRRRSTRDTFSSSVSDLRSA